ncbi:MAG: N-acetylmuramoyl-L-alanine amidase [Lentisphaeria bacterium]|nr:N-acetylmuramoyl-L-alanine amidase [Lentisphaeria bacterium]
MRRLLYFALMLIGTTGCERLISERLEALDMEPTELSEWKLALTSPANRVVLLRDSAVAVVNGIPVELPGPAVRAPRTRWDLPETAVRRVLLPVLDSSPRPVRTILVDPGHGGHDRGTAAASGDTEKDLNLALALRLADALREVGFTVRLTRETDRFLTLDRRAELAGEPGTDLLISVHHNASAANPDAAGMETFALREEDPAESARARAALRLAYLIQREQSGVNRAPGRGVKTARFKVLRLAPVPAVLVEAGFLTNPAEAARCADPEHRTQLARAIARAVLEWSGGNSLR